MPDTPETHTCPICRQPATPRFRWKPPYTLNHCPDCELLFATPQPTDEELDAFYQGFLYRKPNPTRLARLVQTRRRELRNLFHPHLAPNRTFLDYGGGTGIASLAATRLNLNVTLFEIDLDALRFVRSIPDEHPIETISRPADLAGRTFDLLLADNVIEHLKDPRAFLHEIFSLLNPGGHAIIKTPNARCTELYFHPVVSLLGYLRPIYRHNGLAETFAAARFRPWALDPPRHLFSFSGPSLRKLALEIPTADATIGHYRIPLWEYAVLHQLRRPPRTPREALLSAAALLILPFEALSKLIEAPLRALNGLSPGGVYLHLHRP